MNFGFHSITFVNAIFTFTVGFRANLVGRWLSLGLAVILALCVPAFTLLKPCLVFRMGSSLLDGFP